MKRAIRIGAGATLATLAIALPASGRGGGFENQYQGHAERDSDTYVGFDLESSGDKVKVERVQTVLKYHCRGQDSGGEGFARVKGSLTVTKGKFSGELPIKRFAARGVEATGTVSLSGKLRKHGEAGGRVSSNITFPRMKRGGSFEHCYTGGLDWKAKKGAVVDRPAP